MPTTTSSQLAKGNRISWLRISVIVTGYLITLFAVLSVFRIPFAISFLTMIAGFAVVTWASRGIYAAPRVTWRVGLLWFAGSAVIFGLRRLFGRDRVQHWTPHPAGYQVAWFICLAAFRHLRRVVCHESALPNAT